MGALDANGVWIYDEDDRRSPFSDALNLGQDAQSAALAAIGGRLTTVETDLDDRMPLQTFASDAARNAFWGSPSTSAAQLALQAKGPLAIRSDFGGLVQTYLGPYDATTNPQGANPAGWYFLPGTVLGLVRRQFTAGVVLPAGASDVQVGIAGSGTLAITAVVPATPLLLEVDIEMGNANSGANQSISARAFEDTTALGSAKSYPLANVSGLSPLHNFKLAFVFTPASAGKHVYKVQLTPSAASATQYRDAVMRLSSFIPQA